MKSRTLFLSVAALVFTGRVFGGEVVLLEFQRNQERLGVVGVELFEGDAPEHCANFKKLARKGFYKKTSVHRVLPGSLVQMGDPLSRRDEKTDIGTGGPGYTLKPEIRRKHEAGSVGMGRLPDTVNPGRLSNGSQFYVTLSALPALDAQQTVFGRVVEGMQVIQAIGAVATDNNDNPIQKIQISRTKVVESGEVKAVVEQWNKPAKESIFRRVGRFLRIVS